MTLSKIVQFSSFLIKKKSSSASWCLFFVFPKILIFFAKIKVILTVILIWAVNSTPSVLFLFPIVCLPRGNQVVTGSLSLQTSDFSFIFCCKFFGGFCFDHLRRTSAVTVATSILVDLVFQPLSPMRLRLNRFPLISFVFRTTSV